MFSFSRANHTESDTPPPPHTSPGCISPGRSLLKLPLPWTGFEGPLRSAGLSERPAGLGRIRVDTLDVL